MAESFDAYHQWLGIAPKDQPPNHYQLLGIDRYESKANVIDSAADRQMAHLRTFQTGARGKLCQELLNRVSTARVLLLNAQKKAAYDEQMRTKLAQRAEPQPRVAAAIPLSQPAAHLAAAPKSDGAAPLQATASAPQFGGVSSRRRARRKQNSPWLAVGIGGAVLGVVVVIAALATMGGGKDEERANAEPAVRPPKGNSADPTKKPAATAVAKPSGNGERKPTGDPLPEKKPDEDDPVDKEPVEKDPPKESPVDSDNPFEIINDKDPQPNDAPRPAVTKRPAKPAVPSAAAREKAGAEIRKIFDIDAVSDIAAKAKLARELLAAALDTADDPASQYVMLRMVRDTAATHGDYASAERAIGEMSQRFDVDVIAMRSAAVVQALAAKKIPPGHRKRIVRDALRVVQECHTADRYKHAKKNIAAALKAATSLRDKQLLADTRRLRDDGKVLAKQYEAVRGAFETLKTKPADPAANASAGKYLCYVKGDWAAGLPKLALGSDEKLKRLATEELTVPKTSDRQVRLANDWYEAADALTDVEQKRILERAGYWYSLALRSKPALSGLARLKAEKRLSQIKTQVGDYAHASNSSTKRKTIDLLKIVDLKKHVVSSKWQKRGSSLICSSAVHSRFMIPLEIEGGYDLTVEFSRIAGSDCIHLNLPIGEGNTFLYINGWPMLGGRTYICEVNGRYPDKHPNAVKGMLIRNDVWYACHLSVRLKERSTASIEMRLNGKQIFLWQGSVRTLESPHWIRIPNPKCIGIGAHNSSVVFRKIEFKRVSPARK